MRLGVLLRTLKLRHFHNENLWPEDMKKMMMECCTVIPNFITDKEETSLLDEINPHMKRMRYEKSHWDDVSFLKNSHFISNRCHLSKSFS